MLRRLDSALLKVMRTRGHSPATERAMRSLGASGEWGAVWAGAGLTAATLDRRRHPRWLLAAAVGPLAVGANYAVKLAIRRPRPKVDGFPPLAGAPSRHAFPSAHATSSFAAATAMARVAPSTRAPLYALAVLICLTRPYLGMHHPSDVVAGAALGFGLGRVWPGLDGGRAADMGATPRPPSRRPPPASRDPA